MAKKKAKAIDGGIFDLTRAGQARPKDKAYKNYYTEVMAGKKKLMGVVEMMEVDAFLKAKGSVKDSDKDILGKIKGGYKPAVCVIDTIAGIKIGEDVAKACKKLKIDEIPVLVCG